VLTEITLENEIEMNVYPIKTTRVVERPSEHAQGYASQNRKSVGAVG
jgi:hypothetical protein